MTWRVIWTPAAQRDVRRLDRPVADRVTETMQRYADTEQGDVRRLQGVEPPELRLRVGDWRVLFSLRAVDRTLHVLSVKHRGEVYR